MKKGDLGFVEVVLVLERGMLNEIGAICDHFLHLVQSVGEGNPVEMVGVESGSFNELFRSRRFSKHFLNPA